MTHDDNDDRKFETLLKSNKPAIPAAPKDELSILMKRIERVAPARSWFFRSAVALAACLAIVLSVFLIDQDQESEDLAVYAYEVMSQDLDEDEITLVADYELEFE